MYKFTNGVVCYDEATRDKYIKSGMILVKEKPVKKEVEEIGEEEIQSKAEPNEFRATRKRPNKFGRSLK